jgi:hypothetical protein
MERRVANLIPEAVSHDVIHALVDLGVALDLVDDLFQQDSELVIVARNAQADVSVLKAKAVV